MKDHPYEPTEVNGSRLRRLQLTAYVAFGAFSGLLLTWVGTSLGMP